MKEDILWVSDWIPIREAVDWAYTQLDYLHESSGSIPTHDWNLAVKVLEFSQKDQQAKRVCLSCGKVLNYATVIRCLDCKMTFCEHCAPKHFAYGDPKVSELEELNNG